MEISKESYMKIKSPKLRDEMLAEAQIETHKMVKDVATAIVPMKRDIVWLVWGFRTIAAACVAAICGIIKIVE